MATPFFQLGPLAAVVADLCRVHRYDQRGTGGSPWDGEHTIARHVRDLLLDAWRYDRAVLVGHSFGTDLVSFFLDQQRALSWAKDAAPKAATHQLLHEHQLNAVGRRGAGACPRP